MENLAQAISLSNILKLKKDKQLKTLKRINHMIETKTLSISKIRMYKKEYGENSKLIMTKSIAGLRENMDNFIYKLDQLISKEEIEVAKWMIMRTEVLAQIAISNKKIEFFDNEIMRMKKLNDMQAGKIEQMLIEELSLAKKMSHCYE